MSLGWLNLQEYLGANKEQADELAQRLDAQQVELDTQAGSAASRGDVMGYGEFLAKRRTAANNRATASGRAAMLGGDVGDAFLAGQGASNYRPAALPSQLEMMKTAQDRQKSANDYWAKQAERNKGIASQADADRRRQSEGHEAAKRAMVERAGGPGYVEYSDAVKRSQEEARNKQVRRISPEEWDRWIR